MKKLFKTTLAMLLTLSLGACSSTNSTDTVATTASTSSNTTNSNIVNVGVTDTITTLNPLTMSGAEVTKYATGLVFIPLVELNAELGFDYMLADSITTEDNRTFTVHIDENAVWSDGTPITAYDVEYTALRICSPIIANPTLMYYVFEGVNDDGFVEEGATSISGIQVVDDKTITFTTKTEMALNTFMNSYARYLMTLPKHVIESIPESELATSEWFQKPDVISGPYFVDSYDVNHYVSYTANENYFKGAPKIEKLNIRIVDGSQLYAGLQSGEIDITQQTMSVIPQEDYESIEALSNVEVTYGSAVTNQSAFFQTANIDDANVRLAMLYAIDRKAILDGLLGGHGEIVDGFLSSASPYFDQNITPIEYDLEKAQELMAQSNWDSSKTLQLYVNSGDSTMVNAANILVAQWAQIGVNVQVNTVDLNTLMGIAGSMDYDLLVVQYTYPPVDPYTDINWLLAGEGSWTGYSDEAVSEALAQTQTATDEELVQLYSIIDKKMQEDVPMFSLYVLQSMAAKNVRLQNATPTVYGFFNNVHEWTLN